MTNTQTIIDSLLSGYAEQYELSDEASSALERLRQHIVASTDLRKELENLYSVTGFDRLALGCMWVMDRAGAERTGPTPEEVEAVHGAVTLALTNTGMLGGHDTAAPEDVAESSPEPEPPADSDQDMEMTPNPVGTTGEEPAPEADMAEGQGEAPVGPQEGSGSADPDEIGRILEQFLDALQSGADERGGLLADLRASFGACLASEGTDPSLRRYAESVDDFLGYIQENDLLDDVRVMNFFTNIQEPYDQWIKAAEGEREGLLEQAIDFLGDFRSMFE